MTVRQWNIIVFFNLLAFNFLHRYLLMNFYYLSLDWYNLPRILDESSGIHTKFTLLLMLCISIRKVFFKSWKPIWNLRNGTGPKDENLNHRSRFVTSPCWEFLNTNICSSNTHWAGLISLPLKFISEFYNKLIFNVTAWMVLCPKI